MSYRDTKLEMLWTVEQLEEHETFEDLNGDISPESILELKQELIDLQSKINSFLTQVKPDGSYNQQLLAEALRDLNSRCGNCLNFRRFPFLNLHNRIIAAPYVVFRIISIVGITYLAYNAAMNEDKKQMIASFVLTAIAGGLLLYINTKMKQDLRKITNEFYYGEKVDPRMLIMLGRLISLYDIEGISEGVKHEITKALVEHVFHGADPILERRYVDEEGTLVRIQADIRNLLKRRPIRLHNMKYLDNEDRFLDQAKQLPQNSKDFD